MAASRHPILDVAPSLDALPPLAPNLVRTPYACELRDAAARLPFEASAHRFARTPGPAERAQHLAKITNPDRSAR